MALAGKKKKGERMLDAPPKKLKRKNAHEDDDYSGLFGAGRADDGRAPYAGGGKPEAGGDETTIASVVSDPQESIVKRRKVAKKHDEEYPEPNEFPESDEGKGGFGGKGADKAGESGDGGEEGEGSEGGESEEEGNAMAAQEIEAVDDAGEAGEVGGKDAAPSAPQFMKVQSNLSQVDSEKVLEAALFMAGQPLAAADLAKLVGIAAIGHVDEKLAKLASKYEGEASAIEVVKEENGKWSMRVKAAYAPSVKSFAGEAEISRHALKTLAYISRNEGVKKRDLFNKLGSSIYEDVAELVEKGFVTATPAGRTVSLKTTAKFRQYFEG